jgi:hypothetical protein
VQVAATFPAITAVAAGGSALLALRLGGGAAPAGAAIDLRRRGGFAFAHGVPAVAVVRVVALLALVIGVSRAVVRAEAVLARLTGASFVTAGVVSHGRMIDTAVGR